MENEFGTLKCERCTLKQTRALFKAADSGDAPSGSLRLYLCVCHVPICSGDSHPTGVSQTEATANANARKHGQV